MFKRVTGSSAINRNYNHDINYFEYLKIAQCAITNKQIGELDGLIDQQKHLLKYYKYKQPIENEYTLK